MKRAAFLVAVLVGVLEFVTPAYAQSDEELRDKVERCVNDPNRAPDPFNQPRCSFDSKGNLISRDYGDRRGFGGFGGMIPLIIVLGLVWAAIPLYIATQMARDRGDSAATPVLYTLAGGWLGLALYHASTRSRSFGVEPPPPATADKPATASSIAQRLKIVDDLLEQGAITSEEHEERRTAILQET